MGLPSKLSQVARTLNYTGSGSSSEVGIRPNKSFRYFWF